MNAGLECHLSRHFNLVFIHLAYRRIPEHPLSAAADDTTTLYRALLRDGISSSSLVIMDDSAGAGLTLRAIQAILARQLPKPCAAVIPSPWTDMSLSGESHT